MIDLLPKAKTDMDAKGKDDNTALMYAALKGDAEVARALIEAGAGVNVRSKTLDTALMTAVSMNQPEVVKVLVKPEQISM